jgi:hypothetical protein
MTWRLVDEMSSELGELCELPDELLRVTQQQHQP